MSEMSENIQSIANGTYVIGQTSATNFIAGPGITIDQPSAGTVRIGNDETVLWSGSTQLTAMNTSASAIHLSESLYNFDKIGVYAKPLSTHNEYKVSEFTPNSAEEGFDFVNWFKGGGTTTAGAVRFGVAFVQYNSTGMWIKSNELFQLSVDKNGVSTQNNQSIMTKIIGINRISGSNA